MALWKAVLFSISFLSPLSSLQINPQIKLITEASPVDGHDVLILEELSDTELEEICTSRGFELVKDKDDETGQLKKYTHQDYVDAARQCLDIESEMEEILKENPNLLDYIEEESKRMTEEKERLEKEIAEAEAKLEKEKNRKNEVDKDKIPTAFIPSSDDEKDINGEDPGYIEETMNETIEIAATLYDETLEVVTDLDEEGDVIDLDEEDRDKGEDTNETKEGANFVSSPNDDLDSITNLDAGEEAKEQEKEGNKGDMVGDDKANQGIAVAPKVPLSDGSIITAKDVINELRAKMKGDAQRVSDVILPKQFRGPLMDALRPLVRIGKNAGISALDLLKRHLLAVLNSAKNKLDEMESRNENHSSGEKQKAMPS